MRTRFIHDKFILDVSHLDLSWTEENSWFKDSFFLTSSFPFDLDYEENLYFEFFQHYNFATNETYYEGKLEKDGKIEDAILEVEEANDKLRITIRYGVEALPNWNKKLSELDLEVVLPDGGNMRAHAETLISQTYPAVNYNFPAIHSKFYQGAPMFDAFQGVINKRIDGEFISNIADGSATLNRNIVYPVPYFLYVLRSAIEDAGYTLHGDILSDPHFTKSVIVPGKKIANFEDFPEPIEWVMTTGDVQEPGDEHYDDDVWPAYQQWYSEQEINLRGDFQLVGIINDETSWIVFKLNGEIIYNYNVLAGDPPNFNLFFSTEGTDNLLTIFSYAYPEITTTAPILNTFINTIQTYDEEGNPIPYLADFSNVNLATALPDMTVGDLFKFPKLLKNYDLDLRNNKEIWMNLVQNEVENAELVDISEYDLKRPPRKFEQAKSFLLQCEGEYDEKYKCQKIYADKTGYKIAESAKAENTTELTINGIPLPIDTLTSPNDDE